MTFPRSWELLDDFNISGDFPFFISINRIEPSFPAHRHDYLELSLVLSGSGTETINGIRHQMTPGMFTFILPYQIHELRSDDGQTLTLYNCMFSPEFLLNGAGDWSGIHRLLFDRSIDDPGHLLLRGTEFHELDSIMRAMLKEFENHRPWKKTLLQAKLTEALIMYDRLASREYRQPRIEDSSGRTMNMWELLAYMHRNYKESLTLASLSAVFHRNVTYLSEQIKAQFGKTFTELLQEIRVRHAAALLVSTNMKLTEVAEEAGFGSTASLFRVFRGLRGMTPAEFRKGSMQKAGMPS